MNAQLLLSFIPVPSFIASERMTNSSNGTGEDGIISTAKAYNRWD
ncbi:MAG: hypothetical protein AAFW89_10075 [Bacteroidota bacterium]